ncbi:hypothetical protein C8P68_10943 [Mucilaginibacter yixingensis]|uniref:Uncharacterized protein n=1 Tax=Mucilaginibacter yixingensis TaxID=1295612 RepID=A0A2T5J5B2_9SPHI|nr:hypothetical protein [Mucilaginibacter yixingensis]PTQ93171.1 hypothetical protein C8P68_10943 [Mucilaginibacter yixingensis]
MRTSLNNLKLAEEYLKGQATPGDALLFEARLIIEPELQEQIQQQQHAYRLSHQYGRQQLKAQLEEVHERLFTLPRYAGFRRLVLGIFGKR